MVQYFQYFQTLTMSLNFNYVDDLSNASIDIFESELGFYPTEENVKAFMNNKCDVCFNTYSKLKFCGFCCASIHLKWVMLKCSQLYRLPCVECKNGLAHPIYRNEQVGRGLCKSCYLLKYSVKNSGKKLKKMKSMSNLFISNGSVTNKSTSRDSSPINSCDSSKLNSLANSRSSRSSSQSDDLIDESGSVSGFVFGSASGSDRLTKSNRPARKTRIVTHLCQMCDVVAANSRSPGCSAFHAIYAIYLGMFEPRQVEI